MKSSLCILASFVLLVSAAAEPRIWTDSTGSHKVEAEFVRVHEGKVVLKKPDGKMLAIPLDKLSADDKAMAEKMATGWRLIDGLEISAEARATEAVGGEGNDVVLVVKVGGEKTLKATGWGRIVVKSASADSKELRLSPIFHRKPEEIEPVAPHPELKRILCEMRFGTTQDAKSFSLDGSMTVRFGEITEISLGPAAEIKTGPVSNPELKEAGYEVSARRSLGRLTIEIKGDSAGVQQIELTRPVDDRQGAELKSMMVGIGDQENLIVRDFSPLEVVDKSTLVIKVLSNQKEVEIPLQFSGIPIQE